MRKHLCRFQAVSRAIDHWRRRMAANEASDAIETLEVQIRLDHGPLDQALDRTQVNPNDLSSMSKERYRNLGGIDVDFHHGRRIPGCTRLLEEQLADVKFRARDGLPFSLRFGGVERIHHDSVDLRALSLDSEAADKVRTRFVEACAALRCKTARRWYGIVKLVYESLADFYAVVVILTSHRDDCNASIYLLGAK